MIEKITPSEAARMLSARGASKGGRARAKKLSPERRKEIARQAVNARWRKCKKFLVIPGTVTSKSDGCRHYIGARELMRLYRMRPEDCVVLSGFDEVRFSPFSSKYPMNLIALRPRDDGDYSQFWL